MALPAASDKGAAKAKAAPRPAAFGRGNDSDSDVPDVDPEVSETRERGASLRFALPAAS